LNSSDIHGENRRTRILGVVARGSQTYAVSAVSVRGGMRRIGAAACPSRGHIVPECGISPAVSGRGTAAVNASANPSPACRASPRNAAISADVVGTRTITESVSPLEFSLDNHIASGHNERRGRGSRVIEHEVRVDCRAVGVPRDPPSERQAVRVCPREYSHSLPCGIRTVAERVVSDRVDIHVIRGQANPAESDVAEI
jgi:hypothetical protein